MKYIIYVFSFSFIFWTCQTNNMSLEMLSNNDELELNESSKCSQTKPLLSSNNSTCSNISNCSSNQNFGLMLPHNNTTSYFNENDEDFENDENINILVSQISKLKERKKFLETKCDSYNEEKLREEKQALENEIIRSENLKNNYENELKNLTVSVINVKKKIKSDLSRCDKILDNWINNKIEEEWNSRGSFQKYCFYFTNCCCCCCDIGPPMTPELENYIDIIEQSPKDETYENRILKIQEKVNYINLKNFKQQNSIKLRSYIDDVNNNDQIIKNNISEHNKIRRLLIQETKIIENKNIECQEKKLLLDIFYSLSRVKTQLISTQNILHQKRMENKFGSIRFSSIIIDTNAINALNGLSIMNRTSESMNTKSKNRIYNHSTCFSNFSNFSDNSTPTLDYPEADSNLNSYDDNFSNRLNSHGISPKKNKIQLQNIFENENV